MTRRPGARSVRWRIAAASVSAAVAGGSLISAPGHAEPSDPAAPSSAAPTPAEQEPAAPAEQADQSTAAAPAADVLDVEFAGGAPVEQAQDLALSSVGAPTYADDADLGAPVASFDGASAVRAGFADQWSKLDAGFTLECVLRYDGAFPTSGEKDVCSAKESGGFAVYVTGDEVGVMAHIGGGYKNVRATIAGDRWYHVAAAWDGSTLRLYVNGVLAGETAATGALRHPAATAPDFWVGSDGGPNGAQFFAEASVAAARVYAKGVTAEEAKALADAYDTAPAVPEADVLSVDYASGSPAETAQQLRTRTFGDPQIAEDTAVGRQVATFDGQDDAYAYGFHDQWSKLAGGFSVECTFRYNAALPADAEKNLCAAKNAGGFSITIYGDELTFNPYVNGGWRGAAYAIEPNRWYHAVGVWDGQSAKLYVDGTLVAETAAAGTLGVPNSSVKDYFVGADASGGDAPQLHASSTITGTQIFGRALTSDEVSALNVAALGEFRHAEVNLVSSSPAAGSHLSRPAEFRVEIDHPGHATGWRYTLDGEEITPGQTIGAGLAKGDHLIEITARSVFGEPIAWTVPFTSDSIPTGGGTDTGQGAGAVTLSAIATAPGGGDVTTTFKKATATVAEGGFQGVVPALPTSLDFPYDEGSQLAGEQVADGTTAQTPSSRRIPFQRFDLRVPGDVAGQRAVWSGVVDPDRSATLYAWDPAAQAWTELGSSRGVADADTTIDAPLRPGLVVDGTVHLMVTGTDPFADDLSPRDETAQQDKDRFEDPASYDFSMVHFTDTQYLAEGAAGGTYDDWDGVAEPTDVMTAEEQALWQQAYLSSTRWIAENAQQRKIAFTAHSGDVIENDYHDPLAKDATGDLLYPGLDEQVTREFDFTEGAHDVLEQAGVVNQVVAGNHDNQMGAETGAESRFSSTFSPERYYQAQQSWPEGASYHAWDETTDESGATVTQGKDNQNNYVLFSAGGLDFVSVGLSYGVTQEEADWASSVFARYPDRNGILVTHAYLAPSSAPDGRGAGFSTDGSRLFDEVVKANPNVFLVLAGHEHGVGTNLKSDVGVTVKHDVVELLADYQFYKVRADELFPGKADANGNIDLNGDGVTDRKAGDLLQFGASFLRLLQFDTEKSVMSIDTYSPLLDDFGATEYDDRQRYNGSEDNLVLPVDLSTRTTSLATDALTVVTPTDEVIGEDTARSGWPASVQWTGLTEGETYAWTSTSRTGDGDAIGEVDQFGGVFVATAAGTDTTPPVLTLPTGDGANTVQQGESFDPMAGVSATDNVDGDVTDRVEVVGSVDTEVPGTYALSYLVSDTNGNQVTVPRAVTVVAPVEDTRTPVTVTASDARVKFGQKLRLTASLSARQATGTVAFMSGEEVLCEAPVRNGRVTCTVETLPPPGTYPITVSYTGDDTFAEAEGALRLTVTQRR